MIILGVLWCDCAKRLWARFQNGELNQDNILDFSAKMCGIFFCIFKDGECCQKRQAEALLNSVIPLVGRRGPDSLNTEEKTIVDQQTGQQLKLNLTGSVLHLRGDITPQPLQNSKGNALIWNGEIFDGVQVPDEFNDTQVLFNLLENCSDVSSVLCTLSSIQGPWAFVYYQASKKKLWFGRDFFGRRSLVWHLPTDEEDILAVSSVAERCCPENGKKLIWEEVPADGIYCLEFNPDKDDFNHIVESFQFCSFELKRYIWKSLEANLSKDLYSLDVPVVQFNKQLPSQSDFKMLDEHYNAVGLTMTNGLKDHCLSPLNNDGSSAYSGHGSEVCISKENSNSVCSVDSLGDSLFLSINTNDNLSKASKTISVRDSEQNTLKKDSNSICNVDPLATLCNRVIITRDSSIATFLSNLASCHTTKTEHDDNDLSKELIKVLGEAVRKRVFNLPRKQNPDTHKDECCREEFQCTINGEQKRMDGSCSSKCARVGILFSGGIDSIVIAALADRYVPDNEAIDLINVAFEKKQPKTNPTSKRKTKLANSSNQAASFDVPDRITGKSGLKELENINPKRQWNFIEVNVSLQDLQKARSEHITHLVSPLTSVLDDSIGCALWFAARGRGILRCPDCVQIIGAEISCLHPQLYTSKAKVLLVGMGADEQLGGYARHRTRFNQEGWLGLVNEMEMEVNRISKRNLGRDDRCISDHGREARFPFLDEQVVSFLSGLPVWLKADPRLPRGTGEKLLLRKSARLLGLTSSAVLPKRAIQFGSRIAKLEGNKEKGSDTCTRLES